MGLFRLTAGVLLGFASVCNGQDAPIDLSRTSLSDLMDMQVTSVTRKAQRVSEAAAAVYVVTQEDIRRAGATSIPEALRLVPGLDVAQLSGTQWAITSRGFNSAFANKLLVLVDGRTVYSPFFSGVYWDTLDVVLEDIDRIEVIRGPGAAIWGANAVNGVINVITMSARETQGLLVTGAAGNTQRTQDEVRYGSTLGRNAYYRLFGKFRDEAPTAGAGGLQGFDGMSQERVGFRIDGTSPTGDIYRVQGQGYLGKAGDATVIPQGLPMMTERFGVGGGDVMASWQHFFKNRADATAQAYYDGYHRSQILTNTTVHTFDIDLQFHKALSRQHELTAGAGTRMVLPSLAFNPVLQWRQHYDTYTLGSVFGQDEITLVPDRLRLTVGTKFESTNYAGRNLQPSGRLLWTPSRRQSYWVAVSRAVRNPSFTDVGIDLLLAQFQGPFNLPAYVRLEGNPGLKPETVLAYEGGYRVQATRRLSVDLAAFYNRYQHLFVTELLSAAFTSDGQSSSLLVPQEYTNLMHGSTTGLEASVKWKVRPIWEVSGSTSLLDMSLQAEGPAVSLDLLHKAPGDSPGLQFQGHSHLNLPHRLEWDASAYYVSALPNQNVPSYTRVDTRVGWFAGERLSVSLNGQNLASSHHPEFGSAEGISLATSLRRSVYLKLMWRL